jgi:hypothetical protein
MLTYRYSDPNPRPDLHFLPCNDLYQRFIPTACAKIVSSKSCHPLDANSVGRMKPNVNPPTRIFRKQVCQQMDLPEHLETPLLDPNLIKEIEIWRQKRQQSQSDTGVQSNTSP